MDSIPHNLQILHQKIKGATESVGRPHTHIQLVAVSKGKTESDVREAIGAGQKAFGENRVQEAKAKFSNLRNQYPDLELHLIGPLQTNKVMEAIQLFDVIATLDRPKLAEALAGAIKKSGKKPRFLIEVNIGCEPQKAGVNPDDLSDFLRLCRETYGLTVDGLMCIPPHQENPEPYFTTMKNLADQQKLKQLSMGMSGDFEVAIKCGATSVRVGTAIFGERKKDRE